ncbi:MAG: CoA transferase, partial [Anaerolineales bacterium]
LEGAGVPCAPVNDILAALTDPQIVARNMVANIQLETGESAAVAGNAMKLSRTPGESFAPPPRLGGDSDELLRDLLGKTEAEIEALRAQGAI